MKRSSFLWLLSSLLLTGPVRGDDPLPAGQVPLSADISVHGIFLGHPDSAEKVLGKTIPVSEESEGGGFPKAEFLNRAGTEKLTVIAHPGDVVNSFHEFRLEGVPTGDAGAQAKPLPVERFTTGKGLRLGIDRVALEKILGKPVEEKVSEEGTELSYAITDEESPLLKHHHMPSYYGRYLFAGGRLVRIEFGFEYP